jgi:WD40 repeat protein
LNAAKALANNRVSGVAFSPDDQRLVSSSGFKLRLFDVTSGKEVWSTDFRGVIRAQKEDGTAEDLSTMLFSPDGKVIAAGSIRGAVFLTSAESGVWQCW